jgi:hypothetical protein
MRSRRRARGALSEKEKRTRVAVKKPRETDGRGHSVAPYVIHEALGGGLFFTPGNCTVWNIPSLHVAPCLWGRNGEMRDPEIASGAVHMCMCIRQQCMCCQVYRELLGEADHDRHTVVLYCPDHGSLGGYI